MTATPWIPRPRAVDEPACWSWPVPPVRDVETEAVLIAARSREAADPQKWSDAELIAYGYYSPDVLRWDEFHAGVRLADVLDPPARCALCGLPADPQRGRLLDDHCHETGQIRGRLCNRCNIREGRSDSLILQRYRRVHPAAILDTHEMYTGFYWRGGWDLRVPGPSGVRPPTPWPPLQIDLEP